MPASLIQVPSFGEDGGALAVLELGKGLPFTPNRVFWVRSVPPGGVRGEHAHRKCRQVLICIQGEIRAKARDLDGTEKEFNLTPAGPALLMENWTWGEQEYVSSDSILLVLASEPYEESDYIRVYQEFLDLAHQAD